MARLLCIMPLLLDMKKWYPYCWKPQKNTILKTMWDCLCAYACCACVSSYRFHHVDESVPMGLYPWKGPNTCFFKFSNYLIFQEISMFSITYFLRTKNWTVHHGVITAWIFNHAYISIAHVNFDASSWKIVFYRVRSLFAYTIQIDLSTYYK